MKGMKPGQSQPPKEPEYDWLSNIIKVLNDTFGIDLTEDDRVDLNHLRERIMADQELLSFFTPENSRDDIRTKFDEQVDSELLGFIQTKLELYNKLTENRVNTLFKSTWFNELYDQRLRALR
jgi:type I restriction enzyme R subunit